MVYILLYMALAAGLACLTHLLYGSQELLLPAWAQVLLVSVVLLGALTALMGAVSCGLCRISRHRNAPTCLDSPCSASESG